ncbi:MAG: hypothetical protein ABWZ40_01070 [Caulobacterales bacterium]
MAEKPTKIQRLRYAFDNTMAAGPVALIMWLVIATAIVIVIATLLLHFGGIGPEDGAPLKDDEALWASLMRTLDAGAVGADVGWGFRAIMLVVTFWGIFVVSSLIGILSAGVQQKLDELRKGRSIVLEHGHTVILNWSPSIFDIIGELAVAHADDRKFRIVVLAQKDKVEMEDELGAKLDLPGNVRVICRSGDPTDLNDLKIVNLENSGAVIVVASDEPGADSQSIKTILALVYDPNRRKEPYRIAAEFRSAANAAIGKDVGGTEAQIVQADDLLSRIIVQCSRQAGLSAVYSELLDFAGCEIYTLNIPELHGRPYSDAVMAFDKGAIIGICDPQGNVTLNPPMEHIISPQMRAVMIVEDKKSVHLSSTKSRMVDLSSVREAPAKNQGPERTLILGWNRRAPTIVAELASYMTPGSTLTIAADMPDLEQRTAGIVLPNDNLKVFFVVSDTGQQATLGKLDVLSYDHVIVLAYSDELSMQAADTRTLVTLLHLRRVSASAGKHINIVSEMTDIRNRELADITQADDFVVSNRLVSLMLAQASENEATAAIFKDLLDEDGSEIYMRPVEDYVSIAQPVNFFTITESARRRGETAFGYWRKPNSGADTGAPTGVILNPVKAEHVLFAKGDHVIVLAAA